jgi:molybdopterin-guanine dinucleotide biosynthesis protein A
MGRDKALLEVDGVALVRRAAAELEAVGAEAVAVVGRGRAYPGLSLPQIEDRRVDCGPLAGLEAALAWAAPRPVLVLACDLPCVERRTLERLLRRAHSLPAAGTARAWLARRATRLQPLCGLYSAACGPVIAGLLDSGERSVLAAVASIEHEPVDFDDFTPDPFFNVNTPADFAAVAGRAATP